MPILGILPGTSFLPLLLGIINSSSLGSNSTLSSNDTLKSSTLTPPRLAMCPHSGPTLFCLSSSWTLKTCFLKKLVLYLATPWWTVSFLRARCVLFTFVTWDQAHVLAGSKYILNTYWNNIRFFIIHFDIYFYDYWLQEEREAFPFLSSEPMEK